MTNRRDLNQELFGSGSGSATTQPAASAETAPRAVSLSELADLSELTEEQAKVRVKVTHLATQVEALTDGYDHSERRMDKLKAALRSAVGQVERLSSADDLHSQQLGELGDQLRHVESQLEAHQNGDRSKRGDTLDRADRLRAYCHPTALRDRKYELSPLRRRQLIAHSSPRHRHSSAFPFITYQPAGRSAPGESEVRLPAG